MSLLNQLSATVKSNQCRSCGRQLTQEDREQFKGVWTDSAPVPAPLKRYIKQFCKRCINAYKLSTFNAERRTTWLLETRKTLQQKAYTQEEREEARKELEAMEVKPQEIEYLLKGL